MSNDGTIIGSNETIAVRPFGIRDKISYLCDDLGTRFTLGLVDNLLMICYIGVFDISGVIVGSLYSMTKFFDAFVDVGVGRLYDTSKPAVHGRFNPWVRRVEYPFYIVAVVLLLLLMSDSSYTAKIIYICCSYFIYGSLLSAVGIPYGAISAAISSSPDDRVSLSAWRSVGSAIGGGVTGSFIPILMYTILMGGGQVISGQHFFQTSIGYAVLGLIFLSLTCHLTTGRVCVKRRESMPVSVLLEGLARNKALTILVIMDLLIVINQGLSNTNMTYLLNDYSHSKKAMSVALLFTFGSLVLLAPSAFWLTERFGKKKASVGALLFAVVMYVIMYFVHITDTKVYLVFLFLVTLGARPFDLVIWAFMTGVCDHHQHVTSDCEDGTVYGVNFFARKVSRAYTRAIGGFMLAIIGYQPSSTGGVMQTSIVQEDIYTIVNLLPVLCPFSAAVILICFYPLDRTEMPRIEEMLNELNGISK